MKIDCSKLDDCLAFMKKELVDHYILIKDAKGLKKDPLCMFCMELISTHIEQDKECLPIVAMKKLVAVGYMEIPDWWKRCMVK